MSCSRRDVIKTIFVCFYRRLDTIDLASDPLHKALLESYRQKLKHRMKDLNDTFETCTWYRDNWTDSDRNILRGAKG